MIYKWAILHRSVGLLEASNSGCFLGRREKHSEHTGCYGTRVPGYHMWSRCVVQLNWFRDLSMDCLKGTWKHEKKTYLMWKSMAKSVDFPLKQSMETEYVDVFCVLKSLRSRQRLWIPCQLLPKKQHSAAIDPRDTEPEPLPGIPWIPSPRWSNNFLGVKNITR